jgi:hypothetical protein
MSGSLFCFWIFMSAGVVKSAAQLNLKQSADSLPYTKPLSVLPQNFYTQHTGFFCKKEDQLQKRTGLNLFLRLGDKMYTDNLEKKRWTETKR